MSKKVLIIRCGALGDLVYATSVIDALKLEFGEDTIIDFVTTPINATLFKYDNRVNNIFPLKHKKIPVFFSSQKKEIISSSKKQAYDILINFEMGKQFKSLIEKTKAKKKIGWFNEDIKVTKTHMVEICKEFYQSIISPSNLEKSFPKLIAGNFFELEKKFSLQTKNYLVISPSNSHNKKKGINYRAWPHKRWKALIEKLPKNEKLVLIGAKGEEHFFEPLKPYNENIIDLVGKISIPEMISVIENSKALVATDTGTSHVASAVNTPVFCLVGPTPAEQTGPYKTPNNKVIIINKNLPCSPCYKTQTMYDCKENICMTELSEELVLEKLKEENIF